jgi:hypothetical protein
MMWKDLVRQALERLSRRRRGLTRSCGCKLRELGAVLYYGQTLKRASKAFGIYVVAYYLLSLKA